MDINNDFNTRNNGYNAVCQVLRKSTVIRKSAFLKKNCVCVCGVNDKSSKDH